MVGSQGKRHSFVTSELNCGEWPALCIGHFTLERGPVHIKEGPGWAPELVSML